MAINENPNQCRTCRIDYDRMAGSDRLINLLGYYPCVHDATLKGLSLTGTETLLELEIHRMTSEVDSAGYYRNVDHTAVTFSLSGVQIVRLSLESFPEIVFDAEMQLDRSGTHKTPWSVELDLVCGGDLALRCDSIAITHAERMKPV